LTLVLEEFEVVFSVTSPPMARAQTPPPGWSGAGLPGAETNALPCCVRKAVLTLPIAPEIAAPAAVAGIASNPWLSSGTPVWTGAAQSAKAADEVDSNMAK